MERYYDIRIPDTGHGFEVLTRKVCERKFGVPFELYGRNGQEQSGIDLFCNSFAICVQCKNYQGGDASNRLLAGLKKDFLSAYTKFGKKMTKYVLATTVQRDTRVQDLTSGLSEEYSIDIQVLFWEDFQEILNAYPEIIGEHKSTTRCILVNLNTDESYAIPKGANIIGKDIRKCQFKLKDAFISDLHTCITFHDNSVLTIKDLNSRNGTRLNRSTLIPAIEYPLQNGDIIEVGVTKLCVKVVAVAQ